MALSNGLEVWEMDELFKNVSDEQLNFIYRKILAGRAEGLRPRCLDEYIRKVQEFFPLTFSEAWSYAEKAFWDEVGRRYFSKF